MCVVLLLLLFPTLRTRNNRFPVIRVLPRDASVIHYFTHSTQTTVYPQPLETSLSSFQTTLQSSAHCDSDTYFSEVNRFTEWCAHNFPELNTQKTKEMIFDPILIFAHLPVVISNQTIEQVGSYKYLGIHIDSKLSWIVHVEAVCFSAH